MELLAKAVLSDQEKQYLKDALELLHKIDCSGILCSHCPFCFIVPAINDQKCSITFLDEIKKC